MPVTKKKVLVITYYWPPSGGAGVQRWLMFQKYLHEFNVETFIYTPENPEFPVEDESLFVHIHPETKIIKTAIWEPYNIYRKLVGAKKNEKIQHGFIIQKKQSWYKKNIQKASIWLRGNLLIPDPRKFWINPSVKFLENYIKAEKITTIISTGPPHSMHLIARNLKRKIKDIHWIADFRDPWTEIDFYQELRLSNLADKKHKKLELTVLNEADLILSIGAQMSLRFKEILESKTNIISTKFETITNGFDQLTSEEFNQTENSKFSISHIGSMNKARNPDIFWKAIAELLTENSDFKQKLEIRLIGTVDNEILKSIESFNLTPYLTLIPYLNHSEVGKAQVDSAVLLLVVNNIANTKGILTGKFFEYLASKRPILVIGPTDGDLANILNEVEAGKISDFEDLTSLKMNIMTYFHDFQSKNLKIHSKGIEAYSRRNLSEQLAKLIH